MCQAGADHASGPSDLLEESETNVGIKCKDPIHTSSNGRTPGEGRKEGASEVTPRARL